MSSRPFQRFLWWLGGFDEKILRLEECRSIRPKYSAMGTLVLMTAGLATCSGCYALWTIFASVPIAVSLSMAWGVFIFSLDRLLVSSTRKIATLEDYFAGKHKAPPYAPKNPWIPIAIRVAFACAIGFVVSKPIEARLMRPLVMQHEIHLANERLRVVDERTELTNLKQEERDLSARLKAKEEEVKRRRTELSEEIDGRGGTFKYGKGPVAIEKRELLRAAEADEGTLRAQVASKQQAYDNERTTLQTAVQRENRIATDDESVIKALRSIHELATAPDGNASLVSGVSLALTILFVLIESTPVLAKALASFDAYDAALQRTEHGAILDSLSSARDKHEDVLKPKPKSRSAAAGGGGAN